MAARSLAEGPAVETVALEKHYEHAGGRVRALGGIDLSVPGGQFLAIMGSSGAGKSTLLHLLAGLDVPSGGEVHVGNVRVDELSQNESARFRRRHVGIIFQFFNLIPSLTVEENVGLPLLLEGKRLPSVRERIDPLLAEIGLEERRYHSPAALSGGEMQRVAIARALVANPILILADEPTGNLDSKTGEQILALLRRAPDERGVTTILVTHDLRAASYADRVVMLRDGRIEDDLPARRLTGGP